MKPKISVSYAADDIPTIEIVLPEGHNAMTEPIAGIPVARLTIVGKDAQGKTKHGTVHLLLKGMKPTATTLKVTFVGEHSDLSRTLPLRTWIKDN